MKVIPRSPKTEIVGTMADGTLKIKIAAPPEKGKANDELIRFLAAHYRIDGVEIISGHGELENCMDMNYYSVEGINIHDRSHAYLFCESPDFGSRLNA